MELSSFDVSRRSILTKQMTIWVFTIVLVYAVICTPVNIHINSDVLMEGSLLLPIWDVVMDLANYAFYWVSFAFILYAFFRFETRQSLPFFVILGVALLLRYPLNLIAVYFVNGFPLLEDFLGNLVYLLWDILFDLITFGLVIAVMFAIKRRAQNRKYSKQGSFFSDHLPFSKLFSIKNPIQSVLFVGAGWLALGRIVSRVIYDVFLGPPRSLPDLLWMVLYYSFDVVFIFVSVLVCVFLVNRLWFDEARARIELDATAESDRIAEWKQ